MTGDGKMDEQLAAFLESKRDSFEAAPGFDEKVMASLRRASEPAPRKARASGWGERLDAWRNWLRGWLAAPGPRPLWVPACLALALGAFFAVGTFPNRSGEVTEAAPGGTRIKGEGFGFAALVQAGDSGYRKVEREASLRAGDRIQALYWLADSAHVELLSLDARGKVECYSCGRQAGPYAPAAGQPLPFGLELDRAPGTELFILAASPSRRSAGDLRMDLERAWKGAGMDLEKTAEGLRRMGGETMYRTLTVRKGDRI